MIPWVCSQHHSLQDRSSWLNLDHCLRTGFQHLHHIYRHQVGPSMQQESLSSMGTSKVMKCFPWLVPGTLFMQSVGWGDQKLKNLVFCHFSFRLGNWLSSVQNLLPYLLYSQVDKGSHNGWGWAEWRTTPKSSQTRRSLAPVPPPWDLLVEPWHGQGWPGQKNWKRWPNVHAVDEPNGIRMLQRPKIPPPLRGGLKTEIFHFGRGVTPPPHLEIFQLKNSGL